MGSRPSNPISHFTSRRELQWHLHSENWNLPVWYAASAAISERLTAVIQVLSNLRYSCCFEVICKLNMKGLSTFKGLTQNGRFREQ